MATHTSTSSSTDTAADTPRTNSDESSAYAENDPSQLSGLAQSANLAFEKESVERRVAWALSQLPGPKVVVSDFGLESAALLHLAAQAQSDIPVLLIDTGYLYPETYRYAEQLREALALNLHVYRPSMSSARQEAKFGKLWTQGEQGMQTYRRLNKLEPLERALLDFSARTWLQESTREADGDAVEPVVMASGRLRVSPLLDWTAEELGAYLERHGLPTHPLAERGYMRIGDVHAGDRHRAGA